MLPSAQAGAGRFQSLLCALPSWHPEREPPSLPQLSPGSGLPLASLPPLSPHTCAVQYGLLVSCELLKCSWFKVRYAV